MCALQNISDAHDTIIESQVRQTHNTNCLYHEDDTFAISDLVFVSTADLSLLKGQAMKLLPKYVSPFKIIKAYQGTFSYKVELLAQL
jgi:hypothetical protein